MMTRLAVAIVHYRAEHLLERCLQALVSSTVSSWRVCIVDNGSTDGLAWTPGIDPRFAVIRTEKNIGFAAGTNQAIRHLGAAAPYVLMLNPDVVVEPDTLEGVMKTMDRDTTLGAATCRLNLLSGGIDPACRRAEPDCLSALFKFVGLNRLFPRNRFFGRYNMTEVDSSRAHDIQSATCAFLMIRQEALDALPDGLLDERFFMYGEDLDLCRRLREVGYRIRYQPEFLATHVKGSGRIRSIPTTFHFYHSIWIYYRKWGRQRFNPLVLLPLALLTIFFAALEIFRTTIRRTLTSMGGSAARPPAGRGMDKSCGS